jgi:hypothetical protein
VGSPFLRQAEGPGCGDVSSPRRVYPRQAERLSRLAARRFEISGCFILVQDSASLLLCPKCFLVVWGLPRTFAALQPENKVKYPSPGGEAIGGFLGRVRGGRRMFSLAWLLFRICPARTVSRLPSVACRRAVSWRALFPPLDIETGGLRPHQAIHPRGWCTCG